MTGIPSALPAALAKAAGLSLDEERLTQLAFGVATARAAAAVVLAHRLDRIEPASRFVPPPAR
jgi:hypothetical protein